MPKSSFKDYTPIFDLGLMGKNPAVRVLSNEEMDPITLASLVTALFETVMRSVPEDKQIQYEEYFLKSLKTIMKNRHKCDITLKYPNDES